MNGHAASTIMLHNGRVHQLAAINLTQGRKAFTPAQEQLLQVLPPHPAARLLRAAYLPGDAAGNMQFSLQTALLSLPEIYLHEYAPERALQQVATGSPAFNQHISPF